MKRHIFAATTGAALVASLLVGSYGTAQANTDTTAQAAACSSSERVMLRAAEAAPANAAVTCGAPEGANQEGMPATELAQPATEGGKAEIASATEAAGVSKAATPKDKHGQMELAGEPGNLSKAPKAKDTNGQIELASEPGNTSTEVDSR